ncbi:MAG: barstar family protein [Chloroflexi bacterium]|nr:barstar family protein [Chloroflexota bacterium]
MHNSIEIDTDLITDWKSFHATFSSAMGFPDFYGQNMDAWIDCMTSLDDPADGMTAEHAPPGGILVLKLSDASDLASRCPEIYAAIVECSAFVNYRKIEAGEPAVLALSFNKNT